MKISSHADRTEKLDGIRALDIHKWIDGYFDAESFGLFLQSGGDSKFNPYNHRKYRHCAEALDDAYKAFEGKYTREQIKAVFERHVKDDYDGIIPLQEDFERGTFTEKYHESNEPDQPEKILSESELSEYFKGKAYRHEAKNNRKLSARFYWRIVWPTAIAGILFASSAFTIIVPVFRNNMMNQKKQMIKELTSTASSVIEFYIEQEEGGEMSREDAQTQAAKEVAELRYGVDRKDYFWITDMHPKMVMHPYRPELVGKDLTNHKDTEDKSGKKLFVEFVDLVKENNEGYLEYQWQWMDDASRAEPKLSYVTGVPEWGWVVGTGVYIHDIEAEISKLSRNLLIADGVIAAILLGLMGNIIFQSRRIELDRKHAEIGLREAKDRYRALVEGSNEGYVLEVEGETIYSNHTLSRLTGYDEGELARMPLWDLLDPNSEINAPVKHHLQQIYQHTAKSAEFEAQIFTKSGEVVDVSISTSRIFFPEKNGHIISFGRITRGAQDTLMAFYHGKGENQDEIKKQIMDSKSSAQVLQSLKNMPKVVKSMSDQGVHPKTLRQTVGEAYDAAIKRFIVLSLEELGGEPQPFAFLSLGSNARHEMTMFSDQDNALVFADVPDRFLSQTRLQFLTLADDICAKLKQGGYPYCPGGIMAANPKWCLSLSEWKQHFTDWIGNASPESILEINVFLDVHCAYGDESLIHELREHIKELTQANQGFFLHYAKNCLGYKAPLNLLGRIRAAKRGGHKTINLKECIRPLETFARIYAVKHHIVEPGTIDRLTQLYELEVIQKDNFREMVYVFDYLWKLRFYNQIETNAELVVNSDELDLDKLTDIEKENLQSVLSRISVFQTELSYDFLGVAAP
ncbi:cache domain-containing protein [Verrucomicrobiaceae bacterium N1E253]|uniref:Cache domain-containing protein n=1 Tax=Oceaniferula marina TaxID=2748318 RepID=A0A851GG35_9BACT|nr:DUF294 nucleotidyltransferase-like domain-containing protein [Oceaniferula marina]NWK56169.1 cache domain-containing protein [Oceaniferula marina]